ncbi:DUF4304 domain-containing protein [Pinibacter aurantiacus]|uniref:DUF4304 domain-containing protein n=1 Tax=Pinibacter aurantiacus TaxID=2851599 RepID=A0A9E2SCW5_9BACT|nr:DUF4304 domain-containing protein [Pinibacter aurantiacus]MBV4359032.1 DUF4304 domain-containing protein [Pinibacter aurantiacus]
MFKNIIKELSPFLKQFDFVKKGNDFYKVADKNYGIINFQKGRDSTEDVLKFTINFGVYSNVLGELVNGFHNLNKPEIGQCQWEARIGSFMSGSPDFWWSVNTADNLDKVVSDVSTDVQNIIVPELNRRLSDDGLINSWINDHYAGTTEIGKFKYLTTLLKVKGDFRTLNQVVEAFMQQTKGKPNAIRAVEHLKEIGINS